MTRRPSRLLSVVTTVALALGAMTMVSQSVGAFGFLGALLGEAVVHVVGARAEERNDRAAVNARRDSRLRDLAFEEAGIAVKAERGWLTPQQAESEFARIAMRREAIEELAKRERQIISFQTRRQIEEQFWRTLPDAVAAATGANRRIVDFVTGLVRGENPLQAMVAAAIREPAADPRQSFRELADQLAEVKAAAAALGGAETIAIRARLDAVLREAIGLAEVDGIPPDDKIQRLGELTDAVGAAASKLKEVTGRLIPESPGIARERFGQDERWTVLSSTAEALDANGAKQAVSSSVMRRSADRAAAIAEAAGVLLDDQAIEAIALDALSRWVEVRNATAGLDGVTIDLDQLVRDAINESRLANGFEPLPGYSEDPTDVDSEAVRRRFQGQAAFGHDIAHRLGGTCSVTITIDSDLVLEADGTALLFVSDIPSHAFSEDRTAATCQAAGSAQTYSGTWVPSASDAIATINFGSTDELIVIEISGDVPGGVATTSFAYEHPLQGTYRIEFELVGIE